MKRWLTIGTKSALCLLIFAGVAITQYPQDGRPSYSETQGGGFDSPDFDLPDLYGLRHGPGTYRGKVLVLYFLGHD